MTKSQRIRKHKDWPEYVATRSAGKFNAAAERIISDLGNVTRQDICSAMRSDKAPGRPRVLKRCPACDQPIEGSRASRHFGAHSA